MERSRALVTMLLVAALCPVNHALEHQTKNSTLGHQDFGISGGVCKADYSSTFNIDSKELQRTTCNNKNRNIKNLSFKLRQDLDMMRHEFQQLQDLINEEMSIKENQPQEVVPSKKTSQNIREDTKSDSPLTQNKNQCPENKEEVISNPQFMPSDFFGQDSLYFVDGMKKVPVEFSSISQEVKDSSPQLNSNPNNFKQKLAGELNLHQQSQLATNPNIRKSNKNKAYADRGPSLIL